MEKKVVDLLIEKKLHISFAESCTGGLAAARLVDVPDASKVFDAGFITYANDAKVKFMDVSPMLIEKYGAVSCEVALAMAEGAAKAAGAEVGVGISGIAGPGGGTDIKPVGTVCFGFYINGTKKAFCESFGNIGRQCVREKSVEFVFERLAELIG